MSIVLQGLANREQSWRVLLCIPIQILGDTNIPENVDNSTARSILSEVIGFGGVTRDSYFM